MKSLTLLFRAGALAAAAVSLPASAAQVAYTSQAAFAAATNGAVTEFNQAPAGSFIDVSGLTVRGITYQSDYAFMIDPQYSPEYAWGTGPVLLLDNELPSTLRFAPTTAFSAMFGTIEQLGEAVIISGGISSTVSTLSTQNLRFIGFTSDTPFDSLTFTATGGAYPILDNITFANANTVSPVPEPGPLMLTLGGLALMGALGARRRSRGA